MHRSRLTAIGIDVPAADHDRAAAFWAGAVGGEEKRGDDPDDPYITVGHPRGLELFVQRVGDPSPRVHLDIETDDIEAEVSRLETLGAQRVEQVSEWWIMRDPSGLVFCVVGPQSDDFPDGAATWDA
jgi:hypothetical protein